MDTQDIQKILDAAESHLRIAKEALNSLSGEDSLEGSAARALVIFQAHEAAKSDLQYKKHLLLRSLIPLMILCKSQNHHLGSVYYRILSPEKVLASEEGRPQNFGVNYTELVSEGFLVWLERTNCFEEFCSAAMGVIQSSLAPSLTDEPATLKRLTTRLLETLASIPT